VPPARRRWTTYDFTALWVGMAHSVPSWLLASGLVALGMDWKNALNCINCNIAQDGESRVRPGRGSPMGVPGEADHRPEQHPGVQLQQCCI
jgi:NCS1 family nucleobase:cation symporter-1